LCDIDESVLSKRVAQMQKMGLPKPDTYSDVSKLLEDKSTDAVSIATSNLRISLVNTPPRGIL
jgi:predicted dehydrogenase